MFSRSAKSFTLIELLIVVAIIAILALIAVPNFLEAQTRAKVSRAKADLRSIATALESYHVDNIKYPPTPFVAPNAVLRVVPSRLSSPIAYISSANLYDPFILPNLGDFQGISGSGAIFDYSFDPTAGDPEGGDPMAGRRYYYQSNYDPRRISYDMEWQALVRQIEGFWVMASLGPNRQRDLEAVPGLPSGLRVLVPYDPTNGTVSGGDIVRSQKESEGSIKP